MDDLDRVARLQHALLGDREVGAGAAGVQERFWKPGEPMRASSLKQGMRGPVTRSSTVPIRQRSPIRAPETSMPAVVRFSPNVARPAGRGRVSVAPERVVLARVGVDGLVRPAVDGAVGLVVALEVDAAHGDRAVDRLLADRRLDDAPAGGRAAPGARR